MKIIPSATLALSFVSLSGCDDSFQESSLRQAETQPASSKKAPSRGRFIGGEKVRRNIEWPSDELISEKALDLLDEKAKDAILSASLPVLVPSLPRFVKDSQIFLGKTWYAFHSESEGVYISMNASHMARLYPDVSGSSYRPKERIRGTQGWITQNESIWVASWLEHGTAYNLEVECFDFKNTPECQNDEFVRDLAESLVFVGPEEAIR